MKTLQKINQYLRVNRNLMLNKKIDYATIRKDNIEAIAKQFIWPKIIVINKYDEVYALHKDHDLTYSLVMNILDFNQKETNQDELRYLNSIIGKNVSLE
jgi:hypothetical protein